MKFEVGSARAWAWAGVGFSLLGGLFGLLGLVQAAWLSATPDFPPERTARNFLVWGLCVVASAVVLIVSVFVLRKHPGR